MKIPRGHIVQHGPNGACAALEHNADDGHRAVAASDFLLLRDVGLESPAQDYVRTASGKRKIETCYYSDVKLQSHHFFFALPFP
jgi:hypothetical protein